MGADSSNVLTVFSFQDLPAEKLAAAGGKGAVLCSLYRRGYPVPPGFVILPEAFDGAHISDDAWFQVRNQVEKYAKPDGELFPIAAAIITDIGAPLSHAAIVARELGIPAVVGCGDATSRLVDGDRVRVDGARGTVEIL
jgi:phosphoenolpyruvate synthase/pyruvate phosphate dikinase